jgi:hypothetical protein
MNYTESLKKKLLLLADEVNAKTGGNIKFNQQKVTKENMSFSGANGRIRIQPFHGQYDICLSGQSIEKQMCGFMCDICGKDNDGYKQTKPEPHAPFWRVSDFKLVEKATYYYAKTRK